MNRLESCRQRLSPDAQFHVPPALEPMLERRWLAIVSSHLGRSVGVHAEVARYLTQSVLAARRDGSVVLVVRGTAIEPWAKRAAELFAVPVIEFESGPAITTADDTASTVQVCGRISRDVVATAVADRVDCVFVRPRGNIVSALHERLNRQSTPAVRVALHSPPLCDRCDRAALELMDHGAVGWYCGRPEVPSDLTERRGGGGPRAERGDRDGGAPDRWVESSGQWLIHCTRTCDGPWPGQSLREHRDGLLLGSSDGSESARRTPLDSLRRILRMKRVLASAIASDAAYPVVCFSECSLAELLGRRRYRPHLHRWDYEPYGIAIRMAAARRSGFRPVVYGAKDERAALGGGERYRFQSSGSTFDWRAEREWRYPGDVDLNPFSADDVRVFVDSEREAAEFRCDFPVFAVGGILRRAGQTPAADHESNGIPS